MNKPSCVISCPIDCYSGYSSRSRDFVKSLIKIKGSEWDIKILAQRWGNTSWGYLEKHNEQDLISRIIPQMTFQPDYWFQITVPNEFQKVGRQYSVGVTAGIETTICDPSWIEGCNKMDLVLVSSQHAKKVFEESKFEKRDQNKGLLERIELKTPVLTLFEGVDTEVYKKLELEGVDVGDTIFDKLNEIKEEFAFLFCGHWLSGDTGQDRKDVGMLIKTFLETFKNKKIKPALILKTQSATPSIMDRDEMLNKIDAIRKQVTGDLPNIYLLHGELSDNEMNLLYNHPKVKAFVSFTKGEGFGRPLLESSLMQKPVIAPDWSGYIDFLSKEFSILLPGQLTQIHPSAVVQNMLIPESSWFTVDYKLASIAMENVYEKYKDFLERAKRQSYRSRTNFSLEAMQILLNKIIDEKIPKIKPLVLPSRTITSLPKPI